MSTRLFAALALALGLASAAQAQPPAAAASPKNDYTDPATWLCRPGRADSCTVNQDSTVISTDGSMKREVFHANPNPPIDCFYVYPTVSTDPGVNSTMKIEAEEISVALHQFARFGAKCRLYAPMYRQFTLTALTARLNGKAMTGGDPALGYNDVVDAWNEYLTRDNHGRGVVLIGHSQGSGLLTQLIAREIDGKPVQARLVSAILMGTTLQIPPGKDVGGSFQHVPLCHSPSQTGCVIAFASFRADSPPPSDSLFGRGRGGMVAACVNPASLGGGSGELKSYLGAKGAMIAGASADPAWTNPPRPIATTFVSAPGLLTAECVSNEHGSYLAITIHATPGGARANQIAGDVIIGGKVQANWGLHLIDANLNMGNLVDVVGAESKAYLAANGR
jgi:hypothetical protein